MALLVNLVATRCKDGDHAALRRWYNDHVLILMACPVLQHASLYRRIDPADPAAPEYACLYEFPSLADFLAFEVSDARAQARLVLDSGWGRDGIEITQRSQYFRLGRRTSGAVDGQANTTHQLQCLNLGAGLPAETSRWLSDRLHAALDTTAPCRVDWHRAMDASDAGGDALVLLEEACHSAPGRSGAMAGDWWRSSASLEHFGQPPSNPTLRWQGTFERLMSWAR